MSGAFDSWEGVSGLMSVPHSRHDSALDHEINPNVFQIRRVITFDVASLIDT